MSHWGFVMRFLSFMIGLMLAGCASNLPPDYSYSASSSRALLVFDDSIATSDTTLILAPADLETGEFHRLPVQIFAGNSNRIEGRASTGRNVFVAQVEPGTYVVAGTRTAGYQVVTRCYGRGTIAVELVAGEIGILSGGGNIFQIIDGSPVARNFAAPQARVERSMQLVRTIPGIDQSAPVRFLEPVAEVSYEPGLRLVGPGCPGNSRFTITRRMDEDGSASVRDVSPDASSD